MGLGGVRVRAAPGPVRDRWLAHVRRALPPDASWRRIPLHATEGRLLGGLSIIVVPGGKMELAMQIILTPPILGSMGGRRRALGDAPARAPAA